MGQLILQQWGNWPLQLPHLFLSQLGHGYFIMNYINVVLFQMVTIAKRFAIKFTDVSQLTAAIAK
jgi:hypothetical protein